MEPQPRSRVLRSACFTFAGAALVLSARSDTTTPTSTPAASYATTQPGATAIPTTTETPQPLATAVPAPALTATPDQAQGLLPLPPQPERVMWPTDAWPKGPLPDSFDATEFEELMRLTFDEARFGEIHALLIVSGGELVAERYGNGFLGDEAHPSNSISKSVTHALLGVLVEAGQVDMHAPMGIDEWAGDRRNRDDAGQAVAHGIGAAVEFCARRRNRLLNSSESAIVDLRDRLLAADPDTRFAYNTAGAALLGRMIGDLIGNPDELDAWAHDVVFDRLGITSARLGFDNQGYWRAGSHADMTALDYARFGLLYLRDGVWDGERILPEGWVAMDAQHRSTASMAPDSGCTTKASFKPGAPADNSSPCLPQLISWSSCSLVRSEAMSAGSHVDS